MAAPVEMAAVDAGSNAIRLAIARATSPNHIQILETERAAVRLGHGAFTRRMLDDKTIARAARAFRHFRGRMDHHHVGAYRAVATAAAREARNGRKLLQRIRRKSGIELEVISSEEEARLVCAAVRWALGERVRPALIFDLGGGSLEINFFDRGVLQRRLALPLGTIRLMETYSIQGKINEENAWRLQHHVTALLRSALPSPPNLSRAVSVACGGNAEALARLAAGAPAGKVPTISVPFLREQLWRLLDLDVPGRMRVFRLRKDRAEVLGIAAIVIHAVARWLRLRSMLVPGVGVREGLLLQIVGEQYSGGVISDEEKDRAAAFLAGVRWFARRVNYDAPHAEQVARLSLSLFDQLRPLHEMGQEQRMLLEAGAILHDAGYFISKKSHHRHGEYMVRNSEIPGVAGWRRDVIAALVRYHNSKSEPQPQHASYAALNGERRQQMRMLTSLLRIAEKLES
ncbi:MAG: HD domain-containing protein, partial [Acidobacteriota bacterium]|nr:HD domain-containing protein [Acidobacteriota bacterium]